MTTRRRTTKATLLDGVVESGRILERVQQRYETGWAPCPFCQGIRLEMSLDADRYFVRCHDCGARGPRRSCRDASEATRRWNDRAQLDLANAQARRGTLEDRGA